MPKRAYIRIQPLSKRQLKNLAKGREKGWKMPRTEKQLSATRGNIKIAHKLPRTQKQIEASRKLGSSAKGKPNPHGPRVFGDDIIEHHNDLKHGAERPDDITLMTHAEHSSLHNKLRIETGTHNFLAKQQNIWRKLNRLKNKRVFKLAEL